MGKEEDNYRLALKLFGFANTGFTAFVAADRFGPLKAKLGYAWWPSQYETPGGAVFELESMILTMYVFLGISMVVAASDADLSKASYLTHFVVWSGYAHGTVMLVLTFMDWDNEKQHVSPWGDVPLLFVVSTLFMYLKNNYDSAKTHV